MPSLPRTWNRSWLGLAASALVCVGVWYWAQAILVPANTVTVLAARRPIGNNSDLYPRWLGAREVLLHGRDPYSAQITREIQTGFYGRPLDPANPTDPTAQESFVYPLYVVFLLAPTVTLPFPLVAEIFRWILLSSIALSVPLWMQVAGIRLRWPEVVSGMLLAVCSYPAIEEYAQQNLTALIALFCAVAAAAAARNALALSGVFLALATAKPDVTILVVLWLLVWAGARRERYRLIWAFAGSMGLLWGSAQALSPGWTGRFFAAVREYPSYGTDLSVLQALVPPVFAKLVMAALVVLLCVQGWRWKKAAADSDQFRWMLALVTATTLVVIPKLAAYNQVLLIPPFLVLFAQRGAIGSMGLVPRSLAKATFASQGWQWATAAFIALASLGVSGVRMRAAAQIPLYTLLAVPPLALLAVLFAMFSRQERGSLTRHLPGTPGARRG